MRRLLIASACVLWTTAAFAQPATLEITHAEVAYDQRTSRPLVVVTFTEAAGETFARFTAQNVGKLVEFRVDGRSVLKTYIREPIMGRRGQITADSEENARHMAERLSRAGSSIELVVVRDQ